MTPSPGKALETGVVFCLCVLIKITHTWRSSRGLRKPEGRSGLAAPVLGEGRGREKQALGPSSCCYKYQRAWLLHPPALS